MGQPSRPPGQARQRVLDAALDLFVQHSIAGTSLQMIAAQVGVTKAAVYHQFPAKTDIVLALLGDVLPALASLAEAAERTPPESRDSVLIEGIVGLMVGQRRVTSALYRDPEMERIAAADPDLGAVRNKLADLLVEPTNPDAHRLRLGWAVIGAGFGKAIVDPQLSAISDEDMHDQLTSLAHRILA